MILTLVDRRGGSGVLPEVFLGEEWQVLERLVGAIGQGNWPVNFALVDDREMQDLNRRFRQKDAATDVLSFSYLEFEGDGEADLREGAGFAAEDIWVVEDPLSVEAGEAVGELVLAPAFIAERCEANGWPLVAEIPMLVVHGCLHLVGWDHEDEAQKRAMQDHEMTILTGEGLSHPLRKRS